MLNITESNLLKSQERTSLLVHLHLAYSVLTVCGPFSEVIGISIQIMLPVILLAVVGTTSQMEVA